MLPSELRNTRDDKGFKISKVLPQLERRSFEPRHPEPLEPTWSLLVLGFQGLVKACGSPGSPLLSLSREECSAIESLHSRKLTGS